MFAESRSARQKDDEGSLGKDAREGKEEEEGGEVEEGGGGED